MSDQSQLVGILLQLTSLQAPIVSIVIMGVRHDAQAQLLLVGSFACIGVLPANIL